MLVGIGDAIGVEALAAEEGCVETPAAEGQNGFLAEKDGLAVEELRAQGVDAQGLDYYLRPDQQGLGHFHQSNMRSTPFDDGQYDTVLCTHSYFAHHSIAPGTAGAVEGAKILNEFARITKPGGRILLGQMRSTADLAELLKSVPDLEIQEWSVTSEEKWLILRKHF